MDIMTKAKELGELIASSSEMASFKNYEAQMEQDDKAKTLLNDYKQLQIEMVRAAKESKDKETVDSIKVRLLQKQDEINEYDTTKNYLKAKSDVDNLMKTVNNVIIHAITGEDPCSPSKCGSCGGGCK